MDRLPIFNVHSVVFYWSPRECLCVCVVGRYCGAWGRKLAQKALGATSLVLEPCSSVLHFSCRKTGVSTSAHVEVVHRLRPLFHDICFVSVMQFVSMVIILTSCARRSPRSRSDNKREWCGGGEGSVHLDCLQQLLGFLGAHWLSCSRRKQTQRQHFKTFSRQ